jgi:catalase
MISGTADRHNHRDESDYYTQPGNLFHLIPKDAQQRLISDIVGTLGQAPRRIQELQVTHFYKADPAYGVGVAKGLALDARQLRSIEAPELAAT